MPESISVFAENRMIDLYIICTHITNYFKYHVSAVIVIFSLYLFFAGACFGWGKVTAKLLKIRATCSDSSVIIVWVGWACTLLIFQIVHFFLPLTIYIVVPVLITGVLFCAYFLRTSPPIITIRPSFFLSLYVLVLISIAWWIASRSMLCPTNGDSGLYHFNSIRWINEYPLVPGLGNLHGRFAFNQSFFTYAAALNFHPLFGQGRVIANSFLFMLLFIQITARLLPLFGNPSLLTKSHPFLYAVDFLMLPILGHLALTSNGLSSPTPDLASTLLQLSMFLIFVHAVGEYIEGNRDQNHSARTLLMLAATSITIKLSNIMFALLLSIISIAYYIHSSRKKWDTPAAALVVLPSFIIITVWCLRGFILSGYPLYPSTVGSIPVDWIVPPEHAINDRLYIYSWARMPHTHWSNVLGNWDWLKQWVEHNRKNFEGVVYPMASFCALFSLFSVILMYSFLTKKKPVRCLDCIILIPVITGLTFWFFMAPRARFAHALFWLLPLTACLLVLLALQPHLKKRSFVVALCVFFLILNFSFLRYRLLNNYSISTVSAWGFYPVKHAPLKKAITSSGLVLYLPINSDACWDSPLPCTPYYNRNLRLRIPGKIASGFTLETQQEK